MLIKEQLYKLLGAKYTKAAVAKQNFLTYAESCLLGYEFNPERYNDTFVSKSQFATKEEKLNCHKSVSKVIWIFWTGNNDIPVRRLQNIRRLEEISQVEVRLITTHNLQDYILDSDPLPDAFQYLSLNHKSDYLRSYFMHHYGGGYADIKEYFYSWEESFDILNGTKFFGIGYPEIGFGGALHNTIKNKNLQRDLQVHWRLLLGNGAFIFRPGTIFTHEWYEEAKKRLIAYGNILKEHPAQDFFGTNADYPLGWSMMQGAIFHPLCLKYHKFLLKNKNLKPSFKDYR